MHLWDDTKGYLQLPYKKYAYVKDRNGQHISLYGERLKRATSFDKDDPTLHESDIPPMTRFLVDQYTDSKINAPTREQRYTVTPNPASASADDDFGFNETSSFFQDAGE